mgnify:CR=1 FL=1
MQLTYDLPHNVRLADAEEYGINSFDSFYGFVAGLMAGNYDIQEVFVDGILKIGGRDYDALGNMLEKVAVLTKDVNVTFTVSADVDELPCKGKGFHQVRLCASIYWYFDSKNEKIEKKY